MATKHEVRQAILTAAEGLFTRFGPMKTSIADIARELGMSPANIYNFYPSREAILEAVGSQQLVALQKDIGDEIANTVGDWDRITVLFLSTAGHLRDKLENEKDILRLQALVTKNKWRFIDEFHAFLRDTAKDLLTEAIIAERLHHEDPSVAVDALFDCMMTALDPLLLLRFTRDDHLNRIGAQLELLKRAFS